MSDDFGVLPLGSVAPQLVPGPPGWRECDGARLRRRDDPPLYDLLQPLYRRRWRRWIVHVPDMTWRGPRPEGSFADVRFYIRGSV